MSTKTNRALRTTAAKTPSASHVWDWIKPEDVIRHALASFYTACRYCEANSWAYPEGPHHTPDSWLDNFQVVFGARLGVAATEAGIPGYEASKPLLECYTELAEKFARRHSDKMSSSMCTTPADTSTENIHSHQCCKWCYRC